MRWVVVGLGLAVTCLAVPLEGDAHGRRSGAMRGGSHEVTLRARPTPPITPFHRHHGGHHDRRPHGFVPWVWLAPDIVYVLRDEPAAPDASEPEAPPEPTPVSAPVPEPKILLPPAPPPAARPGERTIVIQRGDKLEVHTFPTGGKD